MRSPTREIQVAGVAIQVPAGSMDKPTAEVERTVKLMFNPVNWKRHTCSFTTSDKSLAEDVAYGLDWFLGGHELARDCWGNYVVRSEGYYHYIGA